MERICLVCGRSSQPTRDAERQLRLCCDDCRSLLRLVEDGDPAVRTTRLKTLRFGRRVYVS